MDLNQVTTKINLGINFQDDLQFTKHLADKDTRWNCLATTDASKSS